MWYWLVILAWWWIPQKAPPPPKCTSLVVIPKKIPVRCKCDGCDEIKPLYDSFRMGNIVYVFCSSQCLNNFLAFCGRSLGWPK